MQRTSPICWLHQSLRYGLLFLSIVRPILVVADVVTDAMAIAQVWGSWVGYVMLGVVFVPNLATATALAACMWRCCLSTVARQASSTVPHGVCQLLPMPCERAGASSTGACMPKLPGCVAKPFWKLERASVDFFCMFRSHVWWVFCVVALWLFYLVIGVPMLLLYASLCRGFRVDASRGFRFFNLENCYLLYDRCTGAIEAPVSAGFLVMLLVVGVRRENGLVIEQPMFLYASLCFSIVHMLIFWWDMVHIAEQPP